MSASFYRALPHDSVAGVYCNPLNPLRI